MVRRPKGRGGLASHGGFSPNMGVRSGQGEHGGFSGIRKPASRWCVTQHIPRASVRHKSVNQRRPLNTSHDPDPVYTSLPPKHSF